MLVFVISDASSQVYWCFCHESVIFHDVSQPIMMLRLAYWRSSLMLLSWVPFTNCLIRFLSFSGDELLVLRLFGHFNSRPICVASYLGIIFTTFRSYPFVKYDVKCLVHLLVWWTFRFNDVLVCYKRTWSAYRRLCRVIIYAYKQGFVLYSSMSSAAAHWLRLPLFLSLTLASCMIPLPFLHSSFTFSLHTFSFFFQWSWRYSRCGAWLQLPLRPLGSAFLFCLTVHLVQQQSSWRLVLCCFASPR